MADEPGTGSAQAARPPADAGWQAAALTGSPQAAAAADVLAGLRSTSLGPWGDGAAGALAPAGLDDLLGASLGEGIPRVPLPSPAPGRPLQAAIQAVAAELGLPVPADAEAEVMAAGVDLGPDGERALAQLMLAYAQAVTLRREATAALSDEDRRLLSLQPAAVDSWFRRHPGASWEDYEAAMVVLAAKSDRVRSLQAADLLARAADAARGPLANDRRPALAPPGVPAAAASSGNAWDAVAAMLGTFDGASPAAVPPAGLGRALADLHDAYGLPAPPPAMLAPGLPPSLEAAVAPIVAAKAAGLRGGDPGAEALAVVEAAQAGRPVLQAWGRLLLAAAHDAQQGGPAMAPAAGRLAGPVAAVQAPAAAERLRAATEAAVADLPPAQREAFLQGPRVLALLEQARWTRADAALVQDWADARLAMAPAHRAAIRSAAHALAAAPDRDGDGCADALARAARALCPWTAIAAAESVPLPLPEAAPSSSHLPQPPPTGVLFDDSLLVQPSLLCWVQDGQCAAPASVLRIGGSDDDAYAHPALVHIDLGGDDVYTSEVAGPAAIAPRQAIEAPASTCLPPNQLQDLTGVCAPPRPCQPGQSDWACLPRGMGRGSHAIDYGGDDLYATPALNATQGSAAADAGALRAWRSDSVGPVTIGGGVHDADNLANRAAASVLLDLDGDDTYLAGNRSQGAAADGGVGLLLDATGDDQYGAGDGSQGQVATTGVAASGIGMLADLAGDDRYRFVGQAMLVASNGLALVYDAAGVDEYHSAGVAIDPSFLATTPGPAFLTQGRLAANATGTVSMGAAVFFDAGPDADRYLTLADNGSTADISHIKNRVQRSNDDGAGHLGLGAFLDGQPLDPDDLRDHDDDGVPSLLEDFAEAPAGWPLAPRSARDDPAANWGQAIWALTHPGAPGSEQAGLDRPGAWLAPPPQSAAAGGLAVFLPGFVVAGRADDLHTRWAPFMVDLGGNDDYRAPNAGGVLPYADGRALAPGLQRDGLAAGATVHDWFPTDVALLLDVGATADSVDVYRPDEAACTFTAGGSSSLVAGPGEAAVRGADANPTSRQFAFPAACPSLGGAVNGIAVLGDDGGQNVFRSALAINVTVSTPVLNPQGCSVARCYVAQVAGYGATQGAGLFDGVGILATWGARNDFGSRVTVDAYETDPQPSLNAGPRATARGLAQGAGLGGTGILLSLGGGDDAYLSQVAAAAPQILGGDAGRAEGASQGAGLSGHGLLLDDGGRNTYASPAGTSQGFASGLDVPANHLVGGAPATLGVTPGTPQGASAVTTGGGLLATPSLGILWPGSGPDTLQAGPFSQGAAIGHRSPLVWAAQTNSANAGTVAIGALLDAGGSDLYRLAAPPQPQPLACPLLAAEPGCALGQGGGGAHGLGLLSDLSGDDRYEAAALTRVQGAGQHGVGLLLDHAGHDAYVAAARAQGFAGHGFLSAVQPEGQNVTFQRNSAPVVNLQHTQNRLRLADPATSLGLLLDAAGWDSYLAGDRSQGAGEAVVHPAAVMEECRLAQVHVTSTSVCSTPDQQCITAIGPAYNNDGCGGNRCAQLTAQAAHCEDLQERRQCVEVTAAPAARPCVSSSTQVACIGPCPGAVAGLLLDGGGRDRYEAPGAKCQAGSSPCSGDADGNDWDWQQGAADPLAFGAGSDRPTRDQAAAGIAAALAAAGQQGRAPVSVEVQVARDAAATQLVPPGTAVGGRIHLVAAVTLAPPLAASDVQRVDFLVDGRILGVAGRVPGEPLRYALAWDTSHPADNASVQAYPDGVHEAIASVFLAPGAARTGRDPADPSVQSVESPVRAVPVDNVPRVEARLAHAVLAPDAGQATTLRVRLARDLEGPTTPAPPGGTLRLALLRLGDGVEIPLAEGYRAAGDHVFPVSADSCPGGCPDGRYAVVAEVEDGAGQATTATAGLVMDRLAPRSWVTMPDVANEEWRAGTGINVSWAASDVPAAGGLGSDDVSGVAAVRVLRLAADGALMRDLGEFPPGTAFTTAFGSTGNGQVMRLLTIARDTAGHSESPCLAGEAPPCYRAKLESQGHREVLLDYVRPTVAALQASATHVRPGDAVTFRARVSDPDSGLESVTLRFSRGFPDVPMQAVMGDDHVGLATAFPLGPGEPAEEAIFVYEVLAADRGGNLRVQAGSAVLDSLPPRVAPLPTRYGADENVTAAVEGVIVTLRARVQDAAVGDVRLDLSPLGGSDSQPCTTEPAAPGVWACEALVPLGTADGAHALRWTAVDVAGNRNATEASTVLVSTQPPALQGVQVSDLRHDGFTLRWHTDVPATSLVRYGRDNLTDREALNLTCPAGTPAGAACFRTDHAVDVRGLPSATDFFVKAASASRSGIAREAEPLLVRTASSYRLEVPGLEAGSALKGAATVPVQVTLLDASPQPVRVAIGLQDAAARASPVFLAEVTLGQGTSEHTVDTRQLPDGAYRVVLSGNRAGDFLRVSSAIVRVDNTPPVLVALAPTAGSRAASASPQLNLSVLDPLGTAALGTASLAVKIDGQARPVESAGFAGTWAPGTPQRLTIRLAEPLDNGPHTVHVQLADPAGNVGEAQWSFVVDTAAPRAVGTPLIEHLTGSSAARPGGRIRITAAAQDEATVASGAVLAGDAVVPLLRGPDGQWAAEVQVPAGLPSGPWRLRVSFTDGLGNSAVTATVDVPIDAAPPRFVSASARAAGHTRIAIEVVASEAVEMTASAGSAQARRPTPGATHALELQGLAPGTSHNITLAATDAAGHVATVWLQAATPADDEPPAPPQARAASTQEGVVRLDWAPAADNAGIAAYRVERAAAAGWQRLADLPGSATSYEDGAAPAGRLARYRITAIDVAGHPSPDAETAVQVHAVPRLEEPGATPASGPADSPFTFRVGYRHASGAPPDEAYAQVGDLRIPLALESAGDDCADGCRLAGSGRLPPATLGSAMQARVVVVKDGVQAEIPLDPPRVTVAGDTLQAAPQDAPAIPFAAALACLALAIALRTRRPPTRT